MGFFYGESMSREQTPKMKAAKKGRPNGRRRSSKNANTRTPRQGSPKKSPSARSLVKKAYRVVDKRLDNAIQASKGIDDLVKLLKAQKEMGGEEKPPKENKEVKEIKVRWEPNGEKSSSEK